MNYGSDPADMIVRYSLEGAEAALKLSGLAAKNFAMFVYAVLKDNKKTHGKTNLIRMLKEQRPLKFFTVPKERMREFARESNKRGLLFVPIHNKKNPENIELVVFADDAAKVNRVLDCLNLDFVKAAAGDAAVAQEVQRSDGDVEKEAVQTKDGVVEFEISGEEDEFSFAGPESQAENFTQGREKGAEESTKEKNPSGPSSPSKSSSSGLLGNEQKPSVKKELQEIKREQAEKARREKGERPQPVRNRKRNKKKEQRKGR